MKKFAIINGTTLRVVYRLDMEAAITTAENTCDHSKEVIVREITEGEADKPYLNFQDLTYILLGLYEMRDRPDCTTEKVNETIAKINELLIKAV
jgi:hypothetical protein